MSYSQNGPVSKSAGAFFLGNVLVSLGILVVTTGGSWDISNHLLNRPETFFSTPHFVLYSGVAIALSGAALTMLKRSGDSRAQNRASARLVQIGIALLIGAGPFDFLWHSSFGLDGLLSPPHLALICGMVFSSVGAFLATVKKLASVSRTAGYALTVLGILPIWLSVTGLFFSFSLPFSKTDYFDFNPDPVFGAVFATVAFPFLISLMLSVAYLANGKRFGYLSATGAALILVNTATSILPNPWLHQTMPFYLSTIIPMVLCDIMLKTSPSKMRPYFAGGIFGALGYFVYYPLITHVYNKIDTNQIVSASMTAKIYFAMIPSVFPLVAIPYVALGVIGAILCHRMMRPAVRP